MKMLQINTEGPGNHDDRLTSFLDVNSDIKVITGQEVSLKTRDRLLQQLGFQGVWEKTHNSGDGKSYGIGIFYRPGLMVRKMEYLHYYGWEGYLPDDGPRANEDFYKRSRFGLLSCDFQDEQGEIFTVGTTHFPVARPAHVPNIHQNISVKKLMRIIKGFSNIIIAGDFNFSRSSSDSSVPNPCYTQLIQGASLVDCLPLDVENTLDPAYFRVPHLKVVCDFIFNRGNKFSVSDVCVHSGLSDHVGLVGDVTTLPK